MEFFYLALLIWYITGMWQISTTKEKFKNPSRTFSSNNLLDHFLSLYLSLNVIMEARKSSTVFVSTPLVEVTTNTNNLTLAGIAGPH